MKKHVTIILHRKACQLNINRLILWSEMDWVPCDPDSVLLDPGFCGQTSNAGFEPVDVNYKKRFLRARCFKHILCILKKNTLKNVVSVAQKPKNI